MSTTTNPKLLAFGIPFKTTTQRRYVLVHEHNGKVVIDKRSDSLDTIKAERRRFSNKGWYGYVGIDTVTGSQVVGGTA